MTKIILVINAGSASIKFSVFTDKVQLLYCGIADIQSDKTILNVKDTKGNKIFDHIVKSIDYSIVFDKIFDWLKQLGDKYTLSAVGHRVVHGGRLFTNPVIVTPVIIQQLESLIPLAPLHQPHNINAIKIIANLYPGLSQVACFDNAFHQTQHQLAKLYAIPRELTESGIIHYGFHGLSYEYITSVITEQIGSVGNKRVLIAHLGSGASMCAINQQQSIATSMGFTALDGLMMGSRCGNLDPGVVLYLMQEKGYTADQISDILYKQSGLLGVSGISNDMRALLANPSSNALEAIELFCYRIALEAGRLSIALGGCDAIIFTAGIGENTPEIRQRVCNYLIHWGIQLDKAANNRNDTIISSDDSSVLISVIPTNEEKIIAQHTYKILLA